MEVLYERCCGIDVHKRIVVACLKCGKKQELHEFGTTTEELRSLTEWLSSNNCQMIAMESTGSYWKPLYNIFELSSLDAMVVNARDMRNVPGRKTDVKDAEWIADLLQHGLLRASYIVSVKQSAGLTLPLPYEIMLSIKATKFFKLSQFTKCA